MSGTTAIVVAIPPPGTELHVANVGGMTRVSLSPLLVYSPLPFPSPLTAHMDAFPIWQVGDSRAIVAERRGGALPRGSNPRCGCC